MISDTTKLTDKLMAAVRKAAKTDPASGLTALGFLIGEAANEIIDLKNVRWSEKRAVLARNAEFCAARAEQCWADEVVEDDDIVGDVPAQVATTYDIPADPDEDIL